MKKQNETKNCSRRDLAVLLPLLAANTMAQQPNAQNAGKPAPTKELVPKVYNYNQLPVRDSANGAMKSRAVLDGFTNRGQRITSHFSELAPGAAPHPPARQPHEEIFMLREGTLEVTLNGVTSILEPGAVVFVAYEALVGFKNVGTTVAKYFVVSIEEHNC
jgi:uncharacterized cupin superfamily protein